MLLILKIFLYICLKNTDDRESSASTSSGSNSENNLTVESKGKLEY